MLIGTARNVISITLLFRNHNLISFFLLFLFMMSILKKCNIIVIYFNYHFFNELTETTNEGQFFFLNLKFEGKFQINMQKE